LWVKELPQFLILKYYFVTGYLIHMIVNDTRAYHRQKPPNMDTETTLSMNLTVNYDNTRSGLSYGRILCRELYRRLTSVKDLGQDGLSVAEVGPGLGLSSYDFLVDLGSLSGFDYTAVELSPNLARASALYGTGLVSSYIDADAHEIGEVLDPDSVDIFIANEVVGDMITVDEIPREWLTSDMSLSGEHAEYVYYLRRLVSEGKLPLHNGYTLCYNFGALKLVEDLYSIMKPNGVAFISEHSCEQPIPVIGSDVKVVRGNPHPIGLGDHVEYSMRFSDLEMAAKCVGFETERGRLVDLVDVRDDVQCIPLSSLGRSLMELNIPAAVFSGVVSKFRGIPQQIRTNPRYAYMYLSHHPELLKDFLSLSDSVYSLLFGSDILSVRDVFGQFEYVILAKN
jgi:SAM-dependent methyltransferase